VTTLTIENWNSQAPKTVSQPLAPPSTLWKKPLAAVAGTCFSSPRSGGSEFCGGEDMTTVQDKHRRASKRVNNKRAVHY
jgi:hypothetical protein